MNLLKEIEGITDVKCDCTIHQLTNHINILSGHFGNKIFSENEVLEAVSSLENKETNDVILIKKMTGLEKQMTDDLPWEVIRINPRKKFTPYGLNDVPY